MKDLCWISNFQNVIIIKEIFEGEMMYQCHIYPKFMITINYSFLEIRKDNKTFLLVKIFQFPKFDNYQRFFEGEMISKCHIYSKFMITINYSFLEIGKDNKTFLLAKICQFPKSNNYQR